MSTGLIAANPDRVKTTFQRPNQRWQLDEPHPEAAAELAKSARIPQALAELLIARGVTAMPMRHSHFSILT
jgi:hypothetical protein